MYSPSDFKRGLRILVDDEPYYVISYQHFKMGRGKANIRTKLKHIKTGGIVEKVFSSNDSLQTKKQLKPGLLPLNLKKDLQIVVQQIQSLE